jgi:hypothetical protein
MIGHKDNSDIYSITLATGIILLLTIGLTLCCSSILFIVPLQITSVQLPIGFALAVLTTLFYFSKKGTSRKKHCGIAAVLSIAIIALSVLWAVTL